MAKKTQKPVHHIQMTEGKRNIIQQPLKVYNIETAEDIQNALKELLSGNIKEMMEAEMDNYLGYKKSKKFNSPDSVDTVRKATQKNCALRNDREIIR